MTETATPSTLMLDPANVLPPDNDYKDRDAPEYLKRYGEIKATMVRSGQLQPVRVYEVEIEGEEGPNYQIAFGETRRRICAELGRPLEALVVSEEMASRTPEELTLIENLARYEGSPVDEARAIHALIEATSKKASAIAKIVGRSPAWVSERLKLLKLPDEVQEQIQAGDITVSDAITAAYEQARAAKAGENGSDAATTSANGAKAARGDPGRGKSATNKKVRAYSEIVAQLEGRYALAKVKELQESNPEEFVLRTGYRKCLLWVLHGGPKKAEPKPVKKAKKAKGKKGKTTPAKK